MIKGNPSEGGGIPLSPHTPRQLPHKGLNPPFAGTKANSSSCSPSPLSFHKDHRWELETLRAKLEAERLCSQEARRQFASEVRELRQAAEKDRRLLVDQLRSKWEQQRAWELHQLKEVTQRQREAEIRQLMRWKEAELHEAQELLQQERDDAMRQARDLQRQLAKELVSRGTSSRGGGGGSSSGGMSAECNAKLQEVLSKLRWEVDSEQAARIRHLKAELELERSLFLKYILERFEGESAPAGCPHRFKQQTSVPQHPSGAKPRSLESLIAACTQDVAAVSKPCSLLGNQSRCESPGPHPLLEEGSPGDCSCPEQPEKTASDKELHVENDSKKDTSVDLPPEGKVNICNAAGERAQEVPPQHGWLSGNSYNQLMKQNKDLLDALMDLEQRCACLKEQNTQLRQGSFSDKVKWLKMKTAELAAVAKRLDESTKRYQELSLLKQYENLRREVEEKKKRCAETELELNTVLKENVRISEENSRLHEQNKRAEKIESENADLKEKLTKATDDRNSAVQLMAGLEAKIKNLEEVIKNVKELAEGRQQLESEHEKTLLELQKKEAELQQLQQTQTEIKRQHEEEVQLLDAQVKEYFNLLSQEQHLQSKKPVILESELPHVTCSSTGMSCPEIWEQETDHAVHCNGNTNDQDCTSMASADLIQTPSKLRVFLARYNYDPFNGPNKNPELELPLTAGEYIYVCGDMDEDGFYEGELMNGKRGMVPSNLVEEVAGNDLISFIPSEISDICYNSLHEPDFRCRSASSEGESNSPDEETCVSLLSTRPEGTLCEVQAAGPYPRNLTLIKQSARSVTIGWDPPQMPKSCGEVLSYNIYVNAELCQNVKSGSEMEAVIENLDLKRQTYQISVQSVTDKGNSDQMQCALLVGNTCHVALTLLNLRNITATSAEITWLPSNSKYTHTVCLNEKEYDVTKAGVYCYTFQDLRPNTQYSVKVEPLVPDEALVCPQGGLEQKYMEVTFMTPSAGPPDAPLDVQIRAGSSEGVLVASWLPVTVHESGLSNGVKVIGYAIYINGRKVTEIMSPTAGSILLEVSQIKTIQGPQTLSVRTVSPFGESEDSVPAMIPSFLLKVPSTLFSKSVVPGLTFEESLESEGGLVPETTTSVASSSFSHMCVPSVDTGFTVHFSTNSVTAANDSAGQSSLENCDADRVTPEPSPSSMEFETREDKDVGTCNICLQGAPGIFPEKDQMKQCQQSCQDLSKSTASKVEGQEDKAIRPGSWQNSPADYSHHSDLSDIEEEEEEEDQQTKLNISGDVCKPEEKPESPRELAKGKIITTTLREAQTATNSASNSGLRRNVAAGDSFSEDTERLFVALFDYDPSTMSPNSNADEEELPFKKGQVLKVIGEKDADGFYTGEREGRKGLVPCNMVSEIRIDSMEVKNQLLKKAYEG